MNVAFKGPQPSTRSLDALAEELLLPSGIDGVYARTAAFEDIVNSLTAFISRHREPGTEVLRFPPVTKPPAIGDVGLSEELSAFSRLRVLSRRRGSASTGISVHDNTLNGNVAVSTNCPGYPGAGCYLPYGIEAWGSGTHVYNNTVEGLWANGVAIGAASNLSVMNNLICGPNMAKNNTFVDFEYGSEPGTLIQSNTTSANMTCGAGN